VAVAEDNRPVVDVDEHPLLVLLGRGSEALDVRER
jgi:hypothetical protein